MLASSSALSEAKNPTRIEGVSGPGEVMLGKIAGLRGAGVVAGSSPEAAEVDAVGECEAISLSSSSAADVLKAMSSHEIYG